MPYKSAKQRAFLHIHEPELATKWDTKYGGKVVAPKKLKAAARGAKKTRTGSRNAQHVR